MTGYNLTEAQKALLRQIVGYVEVGKLSESILVIKADNRGYIIPVREEDPIQLKFLAPFDAFCHEDLMGRDPTIKGNDRRYYLKKAAYDAVRRDFTPPAAPSAGDTFIQPILNRQAQPRPADFADLEIRVYRRQGAGYPVELTLDGQLQFDGVYLEPDLLNWVPSAAADQGGEDLFARVFAGPRLKEHWAEIRGRHPQRRVRLRLDPAAPELHTLPWELLREPAPGRLPHTLAADEATPFSRYLAGPWEVPPPLVSRPIKLLVAIASPDNLDEYGLEPLDVEQETALLREVVAGSAATQVSLDFLPPPISLPALAQALRDGPHVLHIVAYGALGQRDKGPAVYLAGEDNRVALTHAADLVAIFNRRRQVPWLVFLASCQSASPSARGAFPALAPELLKARVPAVLATQDLIPVQTARAFAQSFYGQLLEHGLVDLAGNQARAQLIEARLPGWHIPVLFSRLPDNQLITTVPPTSLAFPPAADDETLILIATFHRAEGVSDTEAHREIRAAIRAAAAELDLTTLRAEVEPTILTADDRALAQALGERYRASMIIWGHESTVRLTINFLNLKELNYPAAEVKITETERVAITALSNPVPYLKFITTDLPGQLTFLAFFAVGRSYYPNDAFAEAIPTIERGIAALPSGVQSQGLAEAYYDLGWLYQLILADYTTAETHYTQAIELNPEDTHAYNNRGTTYYEQENYPLALADFDHAITLDPEFAPAYNNRGLTYAKQENYPLALQDYSRAIALDPQDAAAYNNRGNTYYYELENYPLAIADFDRAVELDPQDAKVYCNRGKIYANLGNYPLATDDFDRAIELDPKDAKAYIDRGLTYAKQENYPLALADFDRAIELDPDFVPAHVNRALTYAKQGNCPQALQDYSRAIELDPELALSYSNRGTIYTKQENYPLALVDFDRAIALDPRYAKAYYNRGNTYYKLENYPLAIVDYSRAIELDPKDAKAYIDRGLTYAKQENYPLALADFDRVIELDPQHAAAYNNRGNTYYELENYPLAIADYSRAMALDPELAVAYSNRGKTYAKLENYSLALADYNRAIALNPDYAAAYYNKACVYALQGQDDLMLPPLRRALELNTDHYLNLIPTDSDFDRMRDDPRLQALLAEFTDAQ